MEKEIPKDILEAIESSSIYTKLEKIGDNYNLLLDQIGQLEVDTRMVLIGNIKADKFISTIAKDLEISTQTAEKIAADINNEIFLSLRESLRKMQGDTESDQQTPVQTPPPPSPIPPPTPQVYTPPPPQRPPTPPRSLPIERIDISPNVLSIEKAGDFIIDRAPVSHSPQYNDSDLKKEEVLNEVEMTKKETPKYTADPYRESI